MIPKTQLSKLVRKKQKKIKTCRSRKLDKTLWCKACLRRKKADNCKFRQQQSKTITPDADCNAHTRTSTRCRKKRQFLSDFATDLDLVILDEWVASADQQYEWRPPQRMSGLRRSRRFETKVLQQELRRQLKTFSVKALLSRSFVDSSFTLATTRSTSATDVSSITTRTHMQSTPLVQPTQTDPTPSLPSPDNILSIQNKRRLIQFSYQMMGSPPEYDGEEVDQWNGPDGVINIIRETCSLTSARSRAQIRSVITFV